MPRATPTMTLRAACAAAALLAAAPAGAAPPDEAWTARLRSEGYPTVTVRRSLLGRVWIVATGPQGTREVVVDPVTGEVLRDFLLPAQVAEGAAETPTPAEAAAIPSGIGVTRSSDGAGGAQGGGEGDRRP